MMRECSIKGCPKEQLTAKCERHTQLQSIAKKINKLKAMRMPANKRNKAIADLKKQRKALHQQNETKNHTKRMQLCITKGCEAKQRSSRCDYHAQLQDLSRDVYELKEVGGNRAIAIKEQRNELRQKHQDDTNTEVRLWRLLKSENTYKEALFTANGHRPEHEYGVERATHSDRPYEPTYLECRGQDCKFQRKIQRRKLTPSSLAQQQEYWDVYDDGPDHNDHGHLPAQRISYPWSPEQEAVLTHQFAMGRSFTTTYLLRCLQIRGLVNGCTLEDIKRLCHANRVRISRWEQKDALKLKDLQDILTKMTHNNDDDDDEEASRLKMIPLADGVPHILVGKTKTLSEWKKLTGQTQPRLLEDGHPYAFTFPMASEDSLDLLKHAHEQIHWELRSIDQNGPVLDEKTGIALGLTDGVWKMVKSKLAGVVRAGVTNLSGQFVDIGIIIVSGESTWSLYHGLMAIQRMAGETVGKTFTRWIADSAPGMKAALRSLKHGYESSLNNGLNDDESVDDPNTDDDDFEPTHRRSSGNKQEVYDFGRCSVHTTKDDLHKLREKNPLKKGHFAQFRNRFRQLLKFPPKLFKRAWCAVAARYRKKGNGGYVKSVEDNVIDPRKSGAPMMGFAALGLSSSINSLERSNKWFQQEIEEELIRMEPSATMPTSLVILVEILGRLWPIWTARAITKMEQGSRQLSQESKQSEGQFVIEMEKKKSKVININGKDGEDVCYAFKQYSSPNGPLYPLKKSVALRIAKLWAAFLADPNKRMTWNQFKLMATTTLCTPKVCICWQWGNNGLCFHVTAIRKVHGLPPLHGNSERKLTNTQRGCGRKRRKRRSTFRSEQVAKKARRSMTSTHKSVGTKKSVAKQSMPIVVESSDDVSSMSSTDEPTGERSTSNHVEYPDDKTSKPCENSRSDDNAPCPGDSSSPNNANEGLVNPGNLCYLNALVQCVNLAFRPWAEYMANHARSGTVHEFGSLLLELNQSEVAVNASRLHTQLNRTVNGRLKFGDQQDAHEVWVALYGQLMNQQQPCRSPGGVIMGDYVTVSTLSLYQCVDCGHATYDHRDVKQQSAAQCSLLLELPTDAKDTCSVSQLLTKKYDNEHDGIGVEEFTCLADPPCAENTSRRRKNRRKNVKTKTIEGKEATRIVATSPGAIVVTLGRYVLRNGRSMKNRVRVHLKENEIFKVFSIIPDEGATLESRQLLAVLCHVGRNLNNGHYYTYVSDIDGNWKKYNDASVTESSWSAVAKEQSNAYILLYGHARVRVIHDRMGRITRSRRTPK
jgi:ubiquitin C-terminal hydrolase